MKSSCSWLNSKILKFVMINTMKHFIPLSNRIKKCCIMRTTLKFKTNPIKTRIKLMMDNNFTNLLMKLFSMKQSHVTQKHLKINKKSTSLITYLSIKTIKNP